MPNFYVSSTVYGLRSKGSLSFSFNDYSYLLNERFDRNPVHNTSNSCSRCCTCCTFSTQKVSINPSYLYGLRQSTLLQWSASRKLIFGGGGDRYGYCFPVYDLDRRCYDRPCSFKERSVCNSTSRRRSRGGCCCMVENGDSEVYDLSCLDDAEALLSLLNEEVDEGYVGGRRRNWSSYRRVEVKGRGGFGGRERNLRSSERVQVKKKGNDGNICECGKKKNVGRRLLEGNANRGRESVVIDLREEESRRRKGTGATLRGENGRLGKQSSGGSSYYSFSSSGDFDDETEVRDKHTLLAEESLSGNEESELKGDGRFDGQVTEKYKRCVDEYGDVSEQRNSAVSGGVDWDWRKKPSDRLDQDIQHGRESSQRHGRLLGVHGGRHEKTSSSYKQFNDEAETSTLAVTLDRDSRKQYAQNGNQVVEVSTSRRTYPENKEISEIHRDDVETVSQSRRRVGSMEANVGIDVNLVGKATDEQHKTVIRLAEKDDVNRKTQQLRKISDVQDFDSEMISIQQSRSKMGIIGVGENRTNFLSSRQETEQTDHHTSQQSFQQANLRRKSQQASQISEVYESNVERTSIMQSETSSSNQVKTTNLVSITLPESIEPHAQTCQKPPQRIQSRRRSYDANEIAMVRASETERVIDSQRTSERRVHQESNTMSSVKLGGETREGNNQTNERLQQTKPRLKLEEASTSQEKLSSDQARMQVDGAEEGDQRSSQTLLMPPPSQLFSRSSLHVELGSRVESHKVSSPTSESGASASLASSRKQPLALHHESYERNKRNETHGEPLYHMTPEDALVSAGRLQQSSSHFVGEFVEQVRQEGSTSETQNVGDDSEIRFASEDDIHSQKTLTHYSSEDSQLKLHDKSRSSGGSGTKGPSDEMWDVTDPSMFKTPKTEEGEGTATNDNAVVKRSGRSLWNIISDIVLLRWGSRPETPSSASRSRRKISSNESAGSESWFSTLEPEQSKDKHERDTGLQLETKSDQLQVNKLSSPGQGNESDTLGLAEQIIYHEAAPSSSSPKMIESRSTSKGISLSGDENLGWNEDEKSLRGSASGMEIVESSSQPISRGETSKSGLEEQMEQHDQVKLTEIPGAEGNGGALKRRKFQRTKQVPKDRFDEWEEAHKLETDQRKIDETFMREALLEAKKAADTWEVPVGAVLVQDGKIIARGYNLVEELRDSTAHAEIICIRDASNQLRSWRLADTALYVTLEPCPMCAGAILQARISTLVWGAPNKLLGADGSWIRLFPDGDGGDNLGASDKPPAPVHPFHPNMNIRRGILASECADAMQQFFQLRRKKKEKQSEETATSRLSSSHPSKLLKKMHDVFHIMFCL
ncbi:Cytidine deaminase, homotetrameric [Parasponia andersonii]|uniref:tRNA(adenine(34)) deaminase n=1 Tax=Parasponia andersonii TaxID=3476 RepID=A0A2P5E1I0_PARAD|nr:Cytidine deaminase, homotetrameric [Parasponia andersonii]